VTTRRPPLIKFIPSSEKVRHIFHTLEVEKLRYARTHTHTHTHYFDFMSQSSFLMKYKQAIK